MQPTIITRTVEKTLNQPEKALKLNVNGQSGLPEIPVVIEFLTALRCRLIELVKVGACYGFDRF